MHIDLGDGITERLDADVAVMGAGAAGLTLARRLVEGGRSVLLLESGGLDYEAASADLNQLVTDLGRLIDWGDTRIAGSLATELKWQRDPAAGWTAGTPCSAPPRGRTP